MKEKRYLRLLSFRDRGETAASPTPQTEAVCFDERADEELSEMLRCWEAPAPSRTSEARLLAAYREQSAGGGALWRRLLTASIRVPAPVAAAAVVALVVASTTLALRPRVVSPPAPHALSMEAPTALAPALTPAQGLTKIVEVPVPYERVVTRIVYVEKKKERAAALAERHRQPQEAATVRGSASPARRPDGPGTGYFTRVNMEEFQPADEIKLRIIKRGGGDEH
jgi:hypothetical protein